MKYTFIILACALLVLTSGCKDQHETPPPADSYCLSDSLRKMKQLVEARVTPVQHTLKLSGKITFDQDQVVDIYPQVGGSVSEVHVELGDFVTQGQILAVLKSSQIIDYTQQLVAAQSRLLLAQKDLNVQEDLYNTGLSSKRDFLAAEKAAEMAEAEVNKINEVMKLYHVGHTSDYIVRAPADGYIVEKNIARGMEIRPDVATKIFTVSGLKDVWAVADVYESDIPRVQLGFPVQVLTLSYPDRMFEGRIDKLFTVLDPLTRTMKVRIKLDNPNQLLKPQMFATVRLQYQEGSNKVVIPSKAVIFDKNKYYVMVYKGPCAIETREVSVYSASDSLTYLSTGLKAGEQILSRYQLLVYDELND